MIQPYGAYTNVKDLVQRISGTMTYEPIPPGGKWIIRLHGRRLEVRVTDHSVNKLDSLYQWPSATPRVWEDFPLGEGTPLVSDAFWRLVELCKTDGVPD